MLLMDLDGDMHWDWCVSEDGGEGRVMNECAGTCLHKQLKDHVRIGEPERE